MSGQLLSFWTCPSLTVEICGKEAKAPTLQGVATLDMSQLNFILTSMIILTNILSVLAMKPYTFLSLLAAALGAAQLAGVVVTPQTMASNDSLPEGQNQTSERVPASPNISYTSIAVEPVTLTSPHAPPYPQQGDVFAASAKDPGHACQITSHCPGGTESDEVLAAFKTQLGEVSGYCSFLSSEVSRGLDAESGNG